MSTIKIVRGRWIITGAEPCDASVVSGAIVIDGSVIQEVGEWKTLRQRYPDADVVGDENIAVLPGLINAHHHSHGISTIQHGVPDMVLEPWILAFNRMRASDVYLNTLVGATSQLRSGVTSVVDVHSAKSNADTYAENAGRALKAYEEVGMRVAFAPGMTTQSFLVAGPGEDEKFLRALPDDLRESAKQQLPLAPKMTDTEYLDIMEDLWRGYRDHPRIDVWFGPPGPQWVSDDLMQRIAELAQTWDTGIQTHVDESIYEAIYGPKFYGKHTMLHLHELGVLSPRFSIAHGVWLTEKEIEVMADTGAAISHNPSSNLRLRAGIAPLNGLLEAGVTVGLGMDGTTLNEDEDMFTEMRLAMRLHRTPKLNSPAPTPTDVFRMASTGGAKLLRKETCLGKIAVGYSADLALIKLERITQPWVAPEVDPRDLVLMRAKGEDVDTVLVAGEVVLRNGIPTGFDLEAACRALHEALCSQPYPSASSDLVTRLTPHLEKWYAQWEVPLLTPWISYNSKQ